MKKFIRNLLLILMIISAIGGQTVLAADYDLNTYVYNHLENWDTEFNLDYNNSDVLDVVRNIAEKDDYLSLSLKELVFNKNTDELYITYKTTKSEEEYINTELNKVIKSIITDNMTDVDKVKKINDYLVNRLDYDYGLTSDTAYTALTTGKATCEGYALTAYKMLELAGIENRIVVGKINGVGHGWNLVRLNNKWYQLDITNNDATNSDKYFLTSDDVLKKDGFTWNSDEYPACTEKYYEVNNDSSLSTSNLTTGNITKQASSGYISNIDGNWKFTNGSWYFIKNTGNYAMGWNIIDSNWYYLGNNGVMQTGWIYSSGKWYYCYPGSGAMAVNSIIDGYKVDSSGAWIS
ncbi:transglutaminase-like domain-containing protein [Clostridium sp. BL-8]|uniref:transglutaminase-like domain-containing protein n=1 Tax=Clostridium sp. BL-8 TaxID=349938 RepID=UPI00098CA203|nr:transglutaminase-like domain-containing protein [Clostridium sp. BL-8]OOM79835.1 autolysin [Clostridium sp. BL-8]